MEIVEGGFVLAVLSAGEGVDFASYSRRYFSGEAVSANGNHSIRLNSSSDTSADFPAAAPPPLIHLEAAGDRASAEQREYLDRRLPLALRAFRQRCPILPDEVLVEASMGALLEPWCGLAPGTMTYVRKTNLGTVAFAIAGMTVDLRTGMTSYPQPTRRPRTALARSEPIDKEAPEMIINSALITAEFVGMAFPPYGLILAGGAAIIQMIFGKLMSGGSKVSLAQTISDAVQKTVVNIDLQINHAMIITVYDWFKTNYEAAYEGSGIKKTDEEYKDFKENLNLLIGPFDFRSTINTLKEPAFSAKGLPLFLLGTNLLLLLEKVKLLIDSSDKRLVDTTAYNDVVDTLHNSIGHANTVAPKNKQTIDTELGKITNLNRVKGQCWSAAGGAGCGPDGWEWYDVNGQQHWYNDTSEGGCNNHHNVQHNDEADRDRNKHYSKIQQGLFAQYGDPEKVSKIIAGWSKAVKDYEKYKPAGA